MTQLNHLLCVASETAGNDSRLAEMLGVPQPMVSMWRSGKKPCPPDVQAELAFIAGLDPVQALVRAHLERHEGTAKGERLFSALGKRLHQTGGASVSLIAATAAGSYLIRCILGQSRLTEARLSIMTPGFFSSRKTGLIQRRGSAA